jgi:hypothetical protein
MEDTWRHREACVKAKRSCEGGVFVQWLDKNLDGFTPKRYLDCVLHVRVFWSFSRCLYIYGGAVWTFYLFDRLSFRVSLFCFES